MDLFSRQALSNEKYTAQMCPGTVENRTIEILNLTYFSDQSLDNVLRPLYICEASDAAPNRCSATFSLFYSLVVLHGIIRIAYTRFCPQELATLMSPIFVSSEFV